MKNGIVILVNDDVHSVHKLPNSQMRFENIDALRRGIADCKNAEGIKSIRVQTCFISEEVDIEAIINTTRSSLL